MKTKFLSLFLSLIMVLSCFAAALPAFAEGEEAGSTETTDYDALAVAAGYVARVGTPEKAYADGAFTGYYKSFASVQKGYVPGTGEYANAYDAAVAALQIAEATAEDKTVYMLADVEIGSTFKIGVGITVDGNGHIISGQFHQKIVEFNSLDAVNVATIKNWFVWQRGQHGMVQVSPIGAVANIENCYLLGTGVTTGGLIINQPNQICTVKNTTIKIIDPANVHGLDFARDTGVRIAYDNQHVVMENCVVDCSENFGGTAFDVWNGGSSGDSPAHNSIILTNCIGIGQSYAIYNRDVDLTINGGTYITTLGASAAQTVKVPVLDEQGNQVYETNDKGEQVAKVQSEKVLIGSAYTKSPDTGVSNKEYTAFDGYVIDKGMGGNITFTGTVKLQGGKGGLQIHDDDLSLGDTPGATHNVTAEELAYDADKNSVIWRDATEAAAAEAGAVCYTFNDDGTKTYYKNLTNKDKDYAEADGDAVSVSEGKTIYLIADILMKDDANRASDFAVDKNTIIDGMGFSIYEAGYFCAKAGKSLTMSNLTLYQNANTNRVMVQTDAGSSATLNNVTMIANVKLGNGFFCVRGDLTLNDVKLEFGVGGGATYLMHADGEGMTVTMNNVTADFGDVAGVQGFTTGKNATLNFVGITYISLTGYGLRSGAGEGLTVNIEDGAIIKSTDNTITPYGNKSVINITDKAQVISTAKDAVKPFGHDCVVNISGEATVTGGRYAIATDWENNTEKDYGKNATINLGENVTVTLTETEKSAAAVWMNGRGAALYTNATITAPAGFPAIKITAADASAIVRAGTITGTVIVGAEGAAGTFTTFGGTIDAGAATTEAIIIATGSTANIYEGVIKGGTAPMTGDTYAAGTTEKTYNELSSMTPVFQGYALRMNADSEGMRFTTTVSAEVNAYAQSLVEAGVVADYNYGTFITRATELASAEPTISAFANAGIKHVAIAANEGVVVNSDGSLTYTAAIANFQMKNYGVTLVARAYIAYTLNDGSVIYIYGEAPTANDGAKLDDLAKEALGDVKMAREDGYQNKVSSYYAKDAKGKWKATPGTAYSPYSKAQQALLNLYIEEA